MYLSFNVDAADMASEISHDGEFFLEMLANLAETNGFAKEVADYYSSSFVHKSALDLLKEIVAALEAIEEEVR